MIPKLWQNIILMVIIIFIIICIVYAVFRIQEKNKIIESETSPGKTKFVYQLTWETDFKTGGKVIDNNNNTTNNSNNTNNDNIATTNITSNDITTVNIADSHNNSTDDSSKHKKHKKQLKRRKKLSVDIDLAQTLPDYNYIEVDPEKDFSEDRKSTRLNSSH